MTGAFVKEYRMLSFVPRWAIAPRHNKPTVAEHSFYVALYSSQICDVIQVLPETKLEVMDMALRHDAFEAWTSDIPGPAKRAIRDQGRWDEYELQFDELVPDHAKYTGSFRSNLTPLIIKLADTIDEVYYCKIEEYMGNRMIQGLTMRSLERCWIALKNLEVARPGFRDILWSMIEREGERLLEKGAYIPNRDEDIVKEAAE